MASKDLVVPILGKNDEVFFNLIRSGNFATPTSRITKFAMGLITAGARVPFVPVSLKMPFLKYAFVAGNALGFWKLNYWVGSKTVDDLVASRVSLKIVLFSWLVALTSVLPLALTEISHDKSYYRMLMMGVLLFSGSLFPLRSLQLSLSRILRKFKEKSIITIQNECLSLIKINKRSFVTLTYEEKIELVKRSKIIELCYNDTTNLGSSFLNRILPKRAEKHSTSFCRKAIKSLSYLLTANLLVALGWYTFVKAEEEIYKNDYLAGGFGVLAILSNIYLVGNSVSTTIQKCYDSFVNFISGKREENLANQLRRKLTLFLKLLGFFIDGFALAPSYIFWGDFFKGNRYLQKYFQVSICLTVYLLLFTSTLDITDNMVLELVKKTGSKEEKEILKLYEKYRKLKAILSGKGVVDNLVFKNLPGDFRTYLSGKIGLNLMLGGEEETTQELLR